MERGMVVRHLFFFFLLLFSGVKVLGQEEETEITMEEELSLEKQAVDNDAEPEDDSYLLALQEFRKHPLAINTADENEFRELRILTDLQIHQIINHRLLMGKLISIYELQAVPGWDLVTIRKIRPFITLAEPLSIGKSIGERLTSGNSSILLRTSMVPQASAGYLKDDTSSSGYKGSAARLYLRYQYNYKNLLQFGLLGDKDSGEPFFRDKQKAGFDFYSYHIFFRKLGVIQALALGDYTVNMGQGLIHWQGSGLRKNADAMMIKRQGAVLKPYRSAGEYNFLRGAGITVNFKRVSLTAFASYRRLTSSLDVNDDGVYVSSIITSGYHRTELELAKRKNLGAITGGAVIKYLLGNGSVAINTIHYQFDKPLQPQDKPYDVFGISGSYWTNSSIDYSYNVRNIHAYGEFAIDYAARPAFIQGVLVSLDRKLDFSFVYRGIDKQYQSIAGSSFTENGMPSNEKGLYTGIVIRPQTGWVVNLYADFFDSPWLRFKTDAPSPGRGYLVQVIHTPNKQVEIYSRYSNEQKNMNVSGSLLALPEIQFISKKEWRLQFSDQFNKEIMFRSRVSMSWYGEVDGQLPQKGFLGFTDVVWKPARGIISGSGRLQFFDMDDYNTRIYAYENGPLYDMSIPAFYETGWRYYVNLQLRPRLQGWKNSDLRIWLKYGEVINTKSASFGTGLDKINRSSKSNIKIQVMLSW